MTSGVFKTYLRRFDNAMKYQNRRVLLLLDNFSGHRCDYTAENIEIVFLPPNTTSHCQPLDQGIIHAFKCHFK